ncbi:MAG: hypothetical protein R3E77_12715 [Steroidobacteraceae bacterium]
MKASLSPPERAALCAALLFLALAGQPAMAQTASVSLAELDRQIELCRQRLDPRSDVGFARINARCPALVRTLRRGPWSAWLPQSWNEAGNDLSIDGVAQFAAIVQREAGAATVRAAPHPGSLYQLGERFRAANDEPSNLWTRFARWLRGYGEAGGAGDAIAPAWLRQLLGRQWPAPSMLRLVVVLLLSLVVALVLRGAYEEIRDARARRVRAVAQRDQHPPLPPPAVLSRSDIELAPYHERPALMVRLVLQCLQPRLRAGPAGALTLAELQARFGGMDATIAREFAKLSEVALRARYAAAIPEVQEIAAALASGDRVMGALAQTNA